jgi:hypothetical protein
VARRVSVEIVSDAASARAVRPGDWSKRVEAWVKRTCADQGVPVKLSDPLALAEIAEILCSARDNQTSGGK